MHVIGIDITDITGVDKASELGADSLGPEFDFDVLFSDFEASDFVLRGPTHAHDHSYLR